MLAVDRDELVNLGEYATFAARVRLEFEDPDMVGQSEYRAIYDVCEGFFDHELDHVPAILREFHDRTEHAGTDRRASRR